MPYSTSAGHRTRCFGCKPSLPSLLALTRGTRPYCAPQIEDGRVYCLPDMYEVQDRSLGDIQYVLNPTFTRE